MFRLIVFYSVTFMFGLSVLILSRHTDRPSPENPRNLRSYRKTDDGDENYTHLIPTYPYYGSPDLDKILDKTRKKLKAELKNYNFTYSGVSELKDMVLENGGQPLRTLIISTWRSGSTFLGDIINAVPGTFYNYEPLLSYGIVKIRGPPNADNALKTIGKMLRCDYDGMEKYFKYGKSQLFQFSLNTRLWDHCKHKMELCFDSEFTGNFCKLFPFQSMKLVRVRLNLVKQILEDKELNVKVIFLVRDPRGVMASRRQRRFCRRGPACWNPEWLCADMISDYVAAGRLLQNYPKRLMVVRYEELALNPTTITQKILKHLRISPTPSVEEFLRSHTGTVVPGVTSTFRVSKDVPFRWKNTMDFDSVQKIQTVCTEAMNIWGYNLAHNASHLRSKEFIPVTDYSL